MSKAVGVYEELVDLLKEAQHRSGYTKTEMAEHLGVSQAGLSNIMSLADPADRRRPGGETLENIFTFLREHDLMPNRLSRVKLTHLDA